MVKYIIAICLLTSCVSKQLISDKASIEGAIKNLNELNRWVYYDYNQNVLMVVGGLGFITAGVLGNNKNRRDPFNNQNALFWRVSPSKLAIVLGSGTVVLGLTIRL